MLGEYRKLSALPGLKMEERLLGMLYPGHPYGHGTLGVYEDIVDMPRHFESAMRFYRDWYRPGNVVLVIAGDVRARRVLPLLEARYRGWKPGRAPETPPAPEPPPGEHRAHVGWHAEVAPLLWVAYRMPAFDPRSRRYESFEPRVLIVSAELYPDQLRRRGRAYLDEAAADIIAGLDALKRYASRPSWPRPASRAAGC